MVSIGHVVEDFTVDAYAGNSIKKWKLSDQKGKWVLLMFYPADFTFVCPTELAEAAASYGEFKKLGAEIASISTDTVYVHKAWHDASPAIGTIEYPMLADPAGLLCRQFGTYLENEGVSQRGSFIIDPDGILVAYEVHDNSIGRSISELFRKMEAAKYVREHKGEVCPASWKPGVRTLKPGLDLVGKI